MTTEVRRFVPSADASGADVPATPANLRQPVVGMTTEVRRFVPSADASGADVPATPANLRQPVVGMTPEVRRFDDVDDAVLAAAGAAVRPSDRMVIVHTSGSTSRPKGVIHQHGPLIEQLRVLNEMRRYDEDAILYSASQ